jgi:hypothetical protein
VAGAEQRPRKGRLQTLERQGFLKGWGLVEAIDVAMEHRGLDHEAGQDPA